MGNLMSTPNKIIALVDGNNFYVSCERIFDLKLIGRPVAVLSNNDGCVISRSNECKALGIAMGTPHFQLHERRDLILRSSNYELYGDISRRMITVLQEFSPEVEQYSIDEAFLHLQLPDDCDLAELGSRIRQTLLQWVGIPCGIGFAKSKTLAKIANHLGKKLPGGVFVMPEEPYQILENVPVAEVWGVGQHLSARLLACGVRNAAQLAQAEQAFLQRKFNVTLARTALELQGQPVIAQENPELPSRSISCSRTFGAPVTSLEQLTEALAYYTAAAAEKLRRQKLTACGCNVYFQYCPEYAPRPLEGGFCGTSISFPQPTAATPEMLQAIRPHLQGLFLPGRRYRKSGVLFWGLETDAEQPLALFAAPQQHQNAEKISATLDQLNRTYGKNTVFYLSAGTTRPWQMKREMLSPNYTTSWEELPLVN